MHSKKGFVIPLIIAIIAILTIGGVVLVTQKKEVKAPVATQNPTFITVTNPASGISVKVPKEAVSVENNDGSTKISFGNDYYTSFGFSTTTTKYLTDINQNNITIGVAALDSNECSLKNFSPKGEVTSNKIVKFGDVSFYEVQSSDTGMNQHRDTTKYVQTLVNNICRYVSYNGHSINSGVYDPEYWETTNSTYIKITTELNANNGKFYSAEDMLKTISVFSNVVATTTPPIVGGDKDIHGCIGSAGYSWCEVKNKCLRVWEEKCEVATTSTPKVECKSDNDCMEISCISGGFAHELCTAGKCTFAPGTKERCMATTTNPLACTMDAMMCPDGTYVGRSAPDCKFICPAVEPKIGAGENGFCGGISGIRCASGLTCKYDGTYPDAGGKCIK